MSFPCLISGIVRWASLSNKYWIKFQWVLAKCHEYVRGPFLFLCIEYISGILDILWLRFFLSTLSIFKIPWYWNIFFQSSYNLFLCILAIPIVYILAIVPGLMPWEKGYRFLSFCHVFGSVAPWCGSFIYHLFMNIERGENIYYRLLKLDMLGIWISQSFGKFFFHLFPFSMKLAFHSYNYFNNCH